MMVIVMRATGLRLYRVSVPSLVIIALFFLSYIGLFLLYFGLDEQRYAFGVQDKSTVLAMFLCTSWSIFAIVLGFIFSRNILRLRLGVNPLKHMRPLDRIELFLLLCLLLLCVTILFIYICKIPRVALLSAIFESISDANLARSQMGNDFAGKYHRYNYFMRYGLDLLAFTFFANWLAKPKFGALIMFFIAFIFASISAVIAIEKSPFAGLIVGVFLIYSLVKLSGAYPIKGLIKLGVSFSFLMILFYIYFMGAQSVNAAFASLFSRVFTGAITPSYFYLEYFPVHHDFLYGLSFPNPGGILFHEPYRLTVEVMNWMSPGLLKLGIIGSAPTIFWGEMYANFGYYGVLFVPFFVGVGLWVVSFLVNRLESTPIKAALIVWLILHYKDLAITGLSKFIFDFDLTLVVTVSVIIIAMANNFRKVSHPLCRWTTKV